MICDHAHNEPETKAIAQDVFHVAENKLYGDGIEQLIYASNGNVRRLIQLLDASMSVSSFKGPVRLGKVVNSSG